MVAWWKWHLGYARMVWLNQTIVGMGTYLGYFMPCLFWDQYCISLKHWEGSLSQWGLSMRLFKQPTGQELVLKWKRCLHRKRTVLVIVKGSTEYLSSFVICLTGQTLDAINTVPHRKTRRNQYYKSCRQNNTSNHNCEIIKQILSNHAKNNCLDKQHEQPRKKNVVVLLNQCGLDHQKTAKLKQWG
jgi:hypothetical protein